MAPQGAFEGGPKWPKNGPSGGLWGYSVGLLGGWPRKARLKNFSEHFETGRKYRTQLKTKSTKSQKNFPREF